MHPHARRLLFSVAALLCSCGELTEPSPRREWRFVGLSGETVYVLKAQGGGLYAGTENGIFQKNLTSSDTAWTALGLEGRRIDALLVLGSESLLAGVRVSGTGDDTVSLYRTPDGGATWHPYQNGFGEGEGSNQVLGLARLSTQALLASGGGSVMAKSTDGGQSWRRVWGDWSQGALSTFIETDPHWPGLVWGGGESGFFQPFLVKSRDGGESWSEIWLDVGGDNAHYSIAIDPTDSAHVFTGMEGQLLRSRDGGERWETILSPSSYPYFYGLAVSSLDPRRVYAAGVTNTLEPQELVLYVSSDAGASWSTVVHEGVQYGGIRGFALVENGESETVYVGTEQGVYAHAFE